MDIQNEFNSLYSLLQQSKGSDYVNEILQEIEESEVLLHPKAELETLHVFDVYNARFIMQKEVTKHDLVEGYEGLIDNLRKESNDQLCIFSLTGKEVTYIIFTSIRLDRVIGILKSKGRGIEKTKAINQLYKERKSTVSSRRFYKKILQLD